jgi:hypothetical protein
MRATLTTLAELAGAGLIIAAAWLVWLPAGLLIAGVFLLLFGWLASE